MLTDLTGTPTFGDGSEGHAGIDANLDGDEGNDSKLYLAKNAISLIIAAYPEIDWALARYHQDSASNLSCQLAHWIECRGMCCSYDDPRNNTPPPASPSCTLDGGSSGFVTVQMLSPEGEQCINYSGSCGQPRRGADIVAGFGSSTAQYLMWMDHRETNFDPDETQSDYCNFNGGGDCEMRGTGPTPLAGSIQAAEDFLSQNIDCDLAIPCRKYGVIFLTDGSESCGEDPAAAAADLFGNLGVQVHVIGFSVLPEEVNQLNDIAFAGSGGATGATFVGDEVELANTLAAIVSTSFIQEECNGLDDDCDGSIDEDFPDLGMPCHDDELGVCRGTGVMVCSPAGDSTLCEITDPGEEPQEEVCNGLDDDCDGLIDEDLVCEPVCVPEDEVCDGVDNDCDGAVDEDDPALGSPCGTSDIPPCSLGSLLCISGRLICVGAIDPRDEICNCEDEDCDGAVDNDAPCPADMECIECACREPCRPMLEFSCPAGYEGRETESGWYCLPTPCLYCEPGEICVDNECVNPCRDVECLPNEQCIYGTCYDCHTLGCPEGEICIAGECMTDPCAGFECPEGSWCEMLPDGTPVCRTAGEDEEPAAETADAGPQSVAATGGGGGAGCACTLIVI